MFYGAKPRLFERAKVLRENMTDAENLLWQKLQKKKIMGLRFKAKHPIDIFIVDFYCHKLKLVIEVDGKIHDLTDNKEYDKGRIVEMENYGIKFIRFSNQQIIENIHKVIQEIIKICVERKNEVESQSPLQGISDFLGNGIFVYRYKNN